MPGPPLRLKVTPGVVASSSLTSTFWLVLNGLLIQHRDRIAHLGQRFRRAVGHDHDLVQGFIGVAVGGDVARRSEGGASATAAHSDAPEHDGIFGIKTDSPVAVTQ